MINSNKNYCNDNDNDNDNETIKNKYYHYHKDISTNVLSDSHHKMIPHHVFYGY